MTAIWSVAEKLLQQSFLSIYMDVIEPEVSKDGGEMDCLGGCPQWIE